jgi:hypothetical protein
MDGVMANALTGVAAGSDETCIGDTTADLAKVLARLAVGLSGASMAAPPATRHWKDVTIRLARNKCPDWVLAGGSCWVHATLQAGVVLSAYFATGDKRLADKIDRNLKNKYKASPVKEREMICTNDLGAKIQADIREWSLPGLHVTYKPLQEDCVHGEVVIQTKTARTLLHQAGKQREEAEPKL